MRKLGLDIGEKSCGIALSDPRAIIALGKENYRFETRDWEKLIKHLQNHYLDDVDEIIIGYPTLPSGDKSATTLMIEEFKDLLSQHVSQKIIFVNENHTTTQAHEIMIQAGLSRKKRKNYKDKIAAVLILQSYLEEL